MTDWKLEVAKLRTRRADSRRRYGLHLRAKHTAKLKKSGTYHAPPLQPLPPARALDILRRWDSDYDLECQRKRGQLSAKQLRYLDDVMALTRKRLRRTVYIDNTDGAECWSTLRHDNEIAMLGDEV